MQEGLVSKLELLDAEIAPFYKRLTLMRKNAAGIMYGSAAETQSINANLNVLLEFGFTTKETKRIVRKNPKILMADNWALRKGIESYQSQFHASPEAARTMILRDSSCILGGVKGPKAPLDKFMFGVGFSEEHVRSMQSKHPRLLSYSLGKMVKPRFQRYLEVGLSSDEAVQMFSKEPSMFGKSFANNIGPKIDWFERKVGIDRQTILHEWLVKKPSCIQSQLSVYQKKYETLRQAGFSKEDMVKLMQREARFMNRNIDDLLDKLRFMQDILYKSIDDMVEYPECFDASYDKKLTSRTAYMMHQNQDYQLLPLRALLGSSDSEFSTLYVNSTSVEFHKFVAKWINLSRKEKLEFIRGAQKDVSEPLSLVKSEQSS